MYRIAYTSAITDSNSIEHLLSILGDAFNKGQFFYRENLKIAL